MLRNNNTAIPTYDPDIVYQGEWGVGEPSALMFIVDDGTGDFVHIYDHQDIVEKLKDRIAYLEDRNQELVWEITGD